MYEELWTDGTKSSHHPTVSAVFVPGWTAGHLLLRSFLFINTKTSMKPKTFTLLNMKLCFIILENLKTFFLQLHFAGDAFLLSGNSLFLQRRHAEILSQPSGDWESSCPQLYPLSITLPPPFLQVGVLANILDLHLFHIWLNTACCTSGFFLWAFGKVLSCMFVPKIKQDVILLCYAMSFTLHELSQKPWFPLTTPVPRLIFRARLCG